MTWPALRGQRFRPRRGIAIGLAIALIVALAVSAFAGDSYEALRHAMVEQQVRQRGVTQPEVLAAMEQVPRHLFVPDALRSQAYSDQPLVVGQGRTVYSPTWWR